MKINCNVAQDLMQPYVEDILSKDSRELLEDHLAECESCKAKLDEIRGINLKLDAAIEDMNLDGTATHNEDAVTFKQFKKWIDLRRLIAILITLVVVVTMCIGAAYYIEEYQTYIPFEESGITVSPDGDIVTKSAYQMCVGELHVKDTDGDGEHSIMFLYLTSSIRSRHLEEPGEMSVIVSPRLDVGLVQYDGEQPITSDITEVYYASEKFLKKQKSFNHELLVSPNLSDEEKQALIEEIKADSVLLWKKD